MTTRSWICPDATATRSVGSGFPAESVVGTCAWL
ncbi:Uncharacterised protein [Mycobacteroides abscessus]|nr:Uncharacterised protein [Mycobacteroides abscessus]